ncbi:hypothetical protein Tco_0355509 [Tanacetum coccineum]
MSGNDEEEEEDLPEMMSMIGSEDEEEEEDTHFEPTLESRVDTITALPWSSPLPSIPSSPLPPIPSPSLPVSLPLPVSSPVPVLSLSPPASPIRSLGYQAAMIRMRAEAASTSHLLPLPPPFISYSPTLDQYETGESSAAAAARPIGGSRADYEFVGTMDTEIRRQRAEEVDYGIRDVWVDPSEAVDEDRQTQIYQRVETLDDDSQYHYETARLLDQEALVSREAWGRSIKVSYMTRSEIMVLRSVVMSQQAVISQLQAVDCRRAACADFDLDAVTTGTGDHFTGTGDSTAGTAGTL